MESSPQHPPVLEGRPDLNGGIWEIRSGVANQGIRGGLVISFTTVMMRNFWIRFFLPALLLSQFTALPAAQQPDPQKEQKGRKEESEDYFKKWLEEDVVYIITPEEKSVFKSLTNPLEKEQFIEQFWIRRDKDPRTPENEYKAEHYRRIAYANEHFAAGYPGWMTDRGRIYITFGPPDQITRHSSGETYDRPLYEGGGTTNTYPFEVWRYRHLEGIGDEIELEFVDSTLSGEFRLALSPDEKDALKNLDASGPTLMEQLGLAKKRDRGTINQQLGFERERDTPFRRYETYTKVLTPQPIKYKDLQAIVDVNTQFVELPFSVRKDFVHLNEEQVLALVTVQLENRELQFTSLGSTQSARVAIYGLVSTLTKQAVFEFDDDLETRYAPRALDAGLQQHSVYQKIFPLQRGLHKISLVVKDLNSGKIGTQEIVLDPPAYEADKLLAGPLILADSIQTLPDRSSLGQMFVIGDVKVRPSLSREFSVSNPMGIYCQLYNVQVDSATGNPSLSVTYRVSQKGQVVTEAVDKIGQSIQYSGESRVVLVQRLNVRNLSSGEYRLEVIAQDQISGQQTSIGDRFRVGGD